MSDDTADDIAPASTLSDDPPLDAAQRLGLARFRLGPDAPPWLMETLAFARDEVERLTRERDEAREIIEGRTTTPGKEMDAHGRVGGAWLLAPIGRPPRRSLRHIEDLLLAGVFASDDTDLACLRCAIIEGRARPVRWWPLDNDGRPCAWPTVAP